MKEKEDLDLKAEIDQISRKIDTILKNVETVESERSENPDEKSQ